jgi:hypothetical protein
MKDYSFQTADSAILWVSSFYRSFSDPKCGDIFDCFQTPDTFVSPRNDVGGWTPLHFELPFTYASIGSRDTEPPGAFSDLNVRGPSFPPEC